MKASGEKFVGTVREDSCGTAWIVFLTWRLGFRGQDIVRGGTRDEVCEKLRRLDSSVQFFEQGNRQSAKRTRSIPSADRDRACLGDVFGKYLGGNTA